MALTPGLDADDEGVKISSQPNALVLFNPVLRFTMSLNLQLVVHTWTVRGST